MKFTKEMFVINNFNGNMIHEWDMVSASSIFKSEYKQQEADEEIILSYANALNCITESLLKQNHTQKGIMTVQKDSLTIPFIFLARHTVELILKHLCYNLKIEYKPKHSLMILWDNILEKIRDYNIDVDNSHDAIKIFISVLEELDCDGSHARYSKDNKGNLYNNKPKFINSKKINDFIQKYLVKLVSDTKI